MLDQFITLGFMAASLLGLILLLMPAKPYSRPIRSPRAQKYARDRARARRLAR